MGITAELGGRRIGRCAACERRVTQPGEPYQVLYLVCPQCGELLSEHWRYWYAQSRRRAQGLRSARK